VVVALHGARGSENMFFDAYGNGALVQACVERGWFVIAPRCGLLGGVYLPALLEAMAKGWPIDRTHVVLLGHSMGAMQAVAAAVAPGASYSAIAALGGGGRVPARATRCRAIDGRPSRHTRRSRLLRRRAGAQRAVTGRLSCGTP
jgi:pimeloyl-ACP methyl ester carboxylesterase